MCGGQTTQMLGIMCFAEQSRFSKNMKRVLRSQGTKHMKPLDIGVELNKVNPHSSTFFSFLSDPRTNHGPSVS